MVIFKKKYFLIILLLCFSFQVWPQFSCKLIERYSAADQKEQVECRCCILSGGVNTSLAEKVAQNLGKKLGEVNLGKFNDGEVQVEIGENIRGGDIFIVQSTCKSTMSSINDNLMELFLMIRACKRAHAASVTAVIPYFGYARQDRKVKRRDPISASDISMLLEQAGADHVISIDLHCGQIQGFFHHAPFDELSASSIFVSYMAEKKLQNPVIISPDAGGVPRAKNFREKLGKGGILSGISMIIKQREKAGKVAEMDLVGSVKDSDVIIVDDICDTAGTLCRAASELKKHGAKKVYACITHPVFSSPAISRIAESEIDELIVTDTIPFREKMPKNIKQLSVASLLAQAIKCSHQGESMISLSGEK